MDLWTEGTTGWTADSGETLSADGTNKVFGSYSVYVRGVATWPTPVCRMRLALPSSIDCGGHNGFQQLNYSLRKTGECIGGNYWFYLFFVRLMTDADNYFEKSTQSLRLISKIRAGPISRIGLGNPMRCRVVLKRTGLLTEIQTGET